MNDLVSIITPAYNCEKYIAETIESVLAQTHKNWEMLICDDGSTDGTGRIADNYAAKDPHIHVIHQPNSGLPAAARNAAAKMATGNFIAFLDGDDLWLPLKLEKQIAFLIAHPEFEAVHTSFALTGEPEVLAFHSKYWESYSHEVATIEMMFMRDVMHISTLMIRREAFNSLGGFDETPLLRGSEDVDYMIRLTSRKPVYHIREKLAYYRRLPVSVSLENRDKLYERVSYLVEKTIRTGLVTNPSLIRRKRAQMTYSRGTDALYLLDAPFRKHFLNAFIQDPLDPRKFITFFSCWLPRPLLQKWLSFLLALKNKF